jgi:hypothetical protein
MNLILRWSSARNQKYKMMSPSKSEPVSFDLCGDFWLMVGCFTSSCKYLIHIQNENKVNHIKKLSRKSERSGNDFWLPLEKYVEFRGGSRGGGVTDPLKLENYKIFWRKIVIFHTKYPKHFRASLRSAQFFLSAPPLPWNPGSAPGIG